MPTGKGIEDWTMTFAGKPVIEHCTDEELTTEDEFLMKYPEFMTEISDSHEHIKILNRRIANLKEKIQYIEGKADGYREFWKIWNGESEDENEARSNLAT